MTVSQTARLDIYTWDSGGDSFTRSQMNTSHQNLEATAAGFTHASLPAASAAYEGFFHYSTTDTNEGVLSYCNGAAWFSISEYGTVVNLDGTSRTGTNDSAARSDHTHGIDNNTVVSAMINDNAVTSGKINTSAVTTAKINDLAVTDAKIASGISGTKITADTVGATQLSSTAVTNSKIVSMDAAKLTGSIDSARIAADTVALNTKTTGTYVESVVGSSLITATPVSDNDADTTTITHKTVGFSTGADGSPDLVVLNSVSRDTSGHLTATETSDLSSLVYTKTEVDNLIDMLYGADTAHGGLRIHVGSSVPSGGLGSDGDLYLQWTGP